MLKFQWYNFSELNLEQLYAILELRTAVFVVEQKCPYQDPDGQDAFARHLLGIEEEKLVAYLRLFPPSDTEKAVIFGRVVTVPSARSRGFGKALMQQLLDYCEANFPNVEIQCSAQCYLRKFYESFGFKTYQDAYEEDGIPHIVMRKK